MAQSTLPNSENFPSVNIQSLKAEYLNPDSYRNMKT